MSSFAHDSFQQHQGAISYQCRRVGTSQRYHSLLRMMAQAFAPSWAVPHRLPLPEAATLEFFTDVEGNWEYLQALVAGSEILSWRADDPTLLQLADSGYSDQSTPHILGSLIREIRGYLKSDSGLKQLAIRAGDL